MICDTEAAGAMPKGRRRRVRAIGLSGTIFGRAL